jgi:hypothetical protein
MPSPTLANEAGVALDLGHLLGHCHPAMQQLDALDVQADQLAPAQAIVGGHQDQRPIARVDGTGEGGDLPHGGEPRPG